MGNPPTIDIAQSVAVTQTFEAFYSAKYDGLARALSVTFGDAGWGQEAADEAMTRAYDNWGAVATYGNPAGWCYRVGLNWGRSWHRKLARKLPWSEDKFELPQTPDLALDAALSELDIKYRSVVVCRYLLDWTTEQTAEALEIPTGTVKSRLSAGLAKLKVALGEDQTDQNANNISTEAEKDQTS